MEVTFHGVQITIVADSPEEAYATLCSIFQVAIASQLDNGMEYMTDNFTTDAEPDFFRSTTELCS